MSFFSGFCFAGEEELFEEFTFKSQFCIKGFSYGAQKAIKEALNSTTRIDKIQLFSPAFFQDKDAKFKKLQMIFFKKDSDAYIRNFLENCIAPSTYNINSFIKKGEANELESLLNYTFREEDLQTLVDKGIEIEVYLGEKDSIIDTQNAKDFFVKYATVYFIKKVGHILR